MLSRRTTRTGVALAAILVVSVLVAGCAGKKKKGEDAGFKTAEQSYREGMTLLQKRDLRKAKSVFEQIQYSPENRGDLEPLVRLALADTAFYQRYSVALIDARSMYLDFVTLYGDHPLAPYAQFQAGVCSALQVAHPAKDQTQAFQAMRDLREVEARYPNSTFAIAARTMIHGAQNTLAEHEFQVGRFYLKHKAPLAAAERFQHILDRYPYYDQKDKLYFYLGQALIKSNNEVEARIYLDKLVTNYPNGEFFDEAMKELDKAGGKMDIGVSGSQ